ncbi:MAG: radical SAM protein [Deltaproteobacteria bacterium]|nr:radical SAM protein [Deltaproteobacteria bacterium]
MPSDTANAMRLTDADALELFHRAPLDELCARAHAVRGTFYPAHAASYTIMRIVSYTNICVADCLYCAFYRRPKHPEGYVLTHDAIFAKLDELVAAGGTLVAMEGGFNPHLHVEHYEAMFRAVRDRYGDVIEIYGPTIVEVLFIARISKISLEVALRRLYDAGLRWIPGGGAEILTDVWRRRLSPKKYTVAEYLDAMRMAQRLGFGTTATMVIGFGEECEARVEHLRHIRALQDETGGFASFLLWTYQSDNTALGGARTTQEDYLRTVAISRLYLDNLPMIRTSMLTQHRDGARALLAGAHDFDIPLEDQVTQLAGAIIENNINTVLGWVRSMGMTPMKRGPLARVAGRSGTL